MRVLSDMIEAWIDHRIVNCQVLHLLTTTIGFMVNT